MGIDALLDAPPGADRIVTITTTALAQRNPSSEFPHYLATLKTSLRNNPPPYSGQAYCDIYDDAAQDGKWLAISLVTNAEREGDGATRLWTLSACASDAQEKALLKRHAVDESNHAKWYLAVFDLVFPGAVDEKFHAELRTLSPGYSMSRDVFVVEGSPYARPPTVDDYIQMNIAEIRTTVHHLMQRRALERHCSRELWPKTTQILDTLLNDELSHVAYTAELIEQKAAALGRGRLEELFSKRMRDFNDITRSELERREFE